MTGPASDHPIPTRPLLSVSGLQKHFRLKGGSASVVRAVDDLSFAVRAGETLGIVGESGCGKSTAARLVMNLIPPDKGSIALDGREVGSPGGPGIGDLRKQVQMVFQDSYATLNPRLSIEDTITFGPKAQGRGRAEAKARAHEALDLVGLPPERFAQRYPHEFSGGQRQRANIARALAMRPRVLILDESVSALDKSVEAQVLNLLADLRARLSLTYLFISHDLGVVRYISDRVMVMYLGKVVEIGPVEAVYETPQHPYTKALLASQLSMDPRRRVSELPIRGDLPDPVNPPGGCRFRTRCPLAEDVCGQVEPPLAAPGDVPAHRAACLACLAGSGHSLAPTAVQEAALP